MAEVTRIDDEIEVELGVPKEKFLITISTLGEVLEEDYAATFNADLARTIRDVLNYYRGKRESGIRVDIYGHSGRRFKSKINRDAIFVFELSSRIDGHGKLLSRRVTPWNVEFTTEALPE